jgi:1-acyl-sn-glycerol-3-phosphate acyltransferase
LAASLGVLRPFGRFLEIGKRDIYEDAQLGLLPFRRNLSLHAIDLDRMCVERPDLVEILLREVADGFDRGRLQPLPIRVWPISEIEGAMRFMAQARHTGKLVLSIADSDVTLSNPREPAALFKPDATYVITGGLGGFGLATAERMVRGGAGALVLVGRRPASAEAEQRLALLRQGGARVEVVQGDVSVAADVKRTLDRVRHDMPPLRGIVHAAMVLDDGRMDEMGWPQFERVLAPKMAGAWNLHVQTAADTLDFFVLFSSIAGLFGNPLQANYAAANAYLDALADYRRGLGMPALSIAWGLLSDVGYVAQRPDLFDYIARQGYRAFSPNQALDVFEAALEQQRTSVVAARVDWQSWAAAAPATAAAPHFRRFAAEPAANRAATGHFNKAPTAVDLSDPATRHQQLDSYLRHVIARALGTSPARIEADRPLTECGLDSLIAVELMTTLRMDLGLEMPVVKLLQGMTLNSVAALALDQRGDAATVPRPKTAPLTEPAALTETAPVMAVATQVVTENVPEITAATVKAPIAQPPITQPPIPKPPAMTRAALEADQTHATSEAEEGARDLRDRPKWSNPQRLARFGLALALRASARLTVEGIDRVPTCGPTILAVNHLSAMDVPLALAVLPRPAVMLAKDDLRRWRIVDWLLSDIGHTIYLKRGEGDVDALDRALAVLKSGGMVALGPEGRRSADGLGRGLTGVGYLAAHSGAPVVPMAAWGQERLGRSWRRLRRAPIQVRFGPPLTFADAPRTARDLREHTDAIMRAIAAQLPTQYRGIYAP